MEFGAKQPKEHVVWRSIFGMQLKTRALKPLNDIRLTFNNLILRFAQWQAKERKAFRVDAGNIITGATTQHTFHIASARSRSLQP